MLGMCKIIFQNNYSVLIHYLYSQQSVDPQLSINSLKYMFFCFFFGGGVIFFEGLIHNGRVEVENL